MIKIKFRLPTKADLEAAKFYHETRGQVGGNIVGLVIGFILTFYVLSSTYPTLETAAISLNTSLANSQLSGVANLGNLPGVAVLLFILVTIFGIIIIATRGG